MAQSLKKSFWQSLLYSWSPVLVALAFFVGGAVWGYDPGRVLEMLFAIPLGLIVLLAPVAAVLWVLSWLRR